VAGVGKDDQAAGSPSGGRARVAEQLAGERGGGPDLVGSAADREERGLEPPYRELEPALNRRRRRELVRRNVTDRAPVQGPRGPTARLRTEPGLDGRARGERDDAGDTARIVGGGQDRRLRAPRGSEDGDPSSVRSLAEPDEGPVDVLDRDPAEPARAFRNPEVGECQCRIAAGRERLRVRGREAALRAAEDEYLRARSISVRPEEDARQPIGADQFSVDRGCAPNVSPLG
jgi:hypothetical protein